MTLKLITFDLDDTLWPVKPVLLRAEQIGYDWLKTQHPEIAAQHSLDQLHARRFALLKAEPDLQHNLTALRKKALHQLFLDAGHPHLEATQHSEAAFSVFHAARNDVTLFPQVRDILEQLAQHYTLGSLTNGNADLNRIGLGDLFAFQHSAESVGRRKPEPDIFNAALLSAGVQPHEVLHIGDHPHEDVQAARDHGWHAAWANLLGRQWPESLQAPDYVLEHWNELPALVERVNANT